MSGPIPVRPQEPRWWVSVNGQVEGPYGQAYIIACLNAGQIPTTALLCLEGATQWQPLSAWPQFAADIASPAIQVARSPQSTTNKRPASAAVPHDIQLFGTYAKAISPIIVLAWAGTFFWDFDPNVNTYLELFIAMLIVGIEAVPRVIAGLGALNLSTSPSSAVICFLIGAAGLVVVLGLKVSIVLFGVLVLMESSGPPRPIFVVGGLILLANACELLYLFLSLFTLAQARKRLR